MSTVSVTNVKNASSSVNNAVTTSGGDLTNAAGVSFMSANKNLLYNGAMQVAQRGTSTASITSGGYYTADRWALGLTSLGTWTQSVENDAPTGSGLRKSTRMLCTASDASPASGDSAVIQQMLEGQDVQRIAKGTSSAQQLTLSFWVKANVTGTYVVELFDADNTRSVSASYTVSASATWERKTISFPADTTGAFDNDNASSLVVSWFLGAGSSFTSGTLQTSWGSYVAANRAVGQVNLAAATNNYWQVTGVQLEVGPVATSFEFKSFGQELRECQRYYWRMSHSAGMASWCFVANRVDTYIPHPVVMRASPLLEQGSGTNYFYNAVAGAVYNFNSWILNGTFTTGATLYQTGLGGGTAGQAGSWNTNNAAAYVAFTAEL